MEHSEFSALYRRWYRPMLLYARSLTGDLAAAEDLEQQRQVYEAVLALPEAYRETIVQSAVLGLSDAEIAALRGISQESVRQLRHRARVRLKRMLKEEEP